MGDRVEALEVRMGTTDTTLAELIRQMQSHATQMQQQNAQMQQQQTQMQQQSVILTKLSEQLSQLGTKEPSHEGEYSANNSEQGESRLAGKKVKLPLFDGDDPVAWITRAEIYFDVQNTSDEMRVKLARLSMEGSTIHWFNLLMETEDDLSWEKLKRALIVRYGGRRLENPFEELSTLQQKGTVEEFVESFELLSSQIGRLPEEQYLGYFMSGLKPQIRRRVRTLNPRNRMEMMRIAKDVEGELIEEDDDTDSRFERKGRSDRLGQKDWAGSMRNRNGSQPNDFTRYTNMETKEINDLERQKDGKDFAAIKIARWRIEGVRVYVLNVVIDGTQLCTNALRSLLEF
ncbi:pentatricopeptide repeat-containing protein [Trifolium pratense]|uniref:Pentatricopeptide repeat-containing protein n=1 Tax=Trifolium pratense TaxID=57577 RepID=A0A2K3ML06_TRIPR|nr:pentatricopeptide repeat-containing protein [Trifolium pratense]